jgi:hypothetical protein
MRTSLRKAFQNALSLMAVLLATTAMSGQVTLPGTSPYSENFNTTPGASGTSYPAGWSSYDGTTADNTMAVGNSSSISGGNYNFASRIGILGSGSAFVPGSVVLRIANTTGKTGLAISYDVVKIKEQARSNSFNLEISTTSATTGFTPITGGSYASGTIAQGTSTPYANISLSPADNVNGNVWIRWSYTDISGSGSRDAIALDNVTLSWTSAPVVVTTNATAITSGSATISGTINANSYTVAASFNWGTSVSYGNSIIATPSSVSGATATPISATLSSLSPNALYNYRAVGTVSGTPTNGANISFYTLANVPGELTVGNPTISTLDVTVTPATENSNPSTTRFAIQEAGGSYVQANGSLGATAVWQTAIEWSTVTVTGLEDNTTYSFATKAKNSAVASVETAFGPATSGTTILDTTPTITATALADFGNVCINTVSATNSFTIDGIFLTTDPITVGPLAGFTFSDTETGTYTNSLVINPAGGTFSKVVFVRFGPTAAISYEANIPITGGGASAIDVAALGSGINTPSAVTTVAAAGLTTTTANVDANVTSEGCSAVTERGIVYSTSANPLLDGAGVTKLEDTLAGAGTFTVGVTDLAGGTTYYVKAYSINGSGTSYGTQLTFTTTNVAAPVATAATDVTYNSFTANWDASEGAASYRLDVSESATFGTPSPATELFFSEYVEGSSTNKYLEIYNGTGANVDLSDYRVRLYSNGISTATGSNDVQLSGTLASGSTVVIKNSAAVIYGGAATIVASVNFNGDDAVALYKISTASNVDIFGRIGEDPGAAWTSTTNTTVDKTLIRNAGVTGGVTANPSFGFPTLETEWTLADQNTVGNLGMHTFSGIIPSFVAGYENLTVSGTSQAVTGLNPTTEYYYRVKAVAGNTTGNSNTIMVTTLANTDPTLTVSQLEVFEDVCADAVGGVNQITVSGINLTTEDVVVGPADGFSFSTTETGPFTSTLTITQTGGTFSQEVFVRFEPTDALPYNGNVEIAGGGAESVYTLATGEGLNNAPTVVAASASGITASSAQIDAEVTNAGCTSLTERGVVYGTDPNPEIGGLQVTDAIATVDTYTADLTGLIGGTVYYVRAYAINDGGTSYSEEITFTTSDVDSPVATNATAIGSDRFTANWKLSEGAASYRLDVSESATFGTSVQASDLFFSEYVEGSSLNKYLEIYNGTGASVDLSDYRVRLFSNGSTSATGTNDVQLSGTLDSGNTVVIKNSGATIYSGTATIIASVNFNGDDAVALYKISTASNVDIFGRIGEDPGVAWTSTTNTTVDKTLIRNASVTGGVTANPSSGFPTLETEWTLADQNETGNLGSHTFSVSIPSFVAGYEDLTVYTDNQEVTGLNPNTMYYYRVRAVAGNTSGNSATVSVTTVAESMRAASSETAMKQSINEIVVFMQNDVLNIKSGTAIRSVMVYDIAGKLLFSSDSFNDQDVAIQKLSASNQVLVVKIGTVDNQLVTRKVVY